MKNGREEDISWEGGKNVVNVEWEGVEGNEENGEEGEEGFWMRE